jgi:hypothetical protein
MTAAEQRQKQPVAARVSNAQDADAVRSDAQTSWCSSVIVRPKKIAVGGVQAIHEKS